MNPINGDANFDIDRDISKMQSDLFDERLLTKESYFN